MDVPAVPVPVVVVFVLAVFAAEFLVSTPIQDFFPAFQAFQRFKVGFLIVHRCVVYESEYVEDLIKRQTE